MRALRSLALALIALAVPMLPAPAQACQGTAAFQDGSWRVGVDDQHNGDFNDVRGSMTYGARRSFFGGASLDKMRFAQGGSTTNGVGVNFGYQVALSDTPFQFCPEVWAHYAAGTGSNAQYQAAFGGSIGYQGEISDRFSLVPAAGIWFISTSTSDMVVNIVQPTSGPSATSPEPDNGASNQMFMTIGLVFNKTITISPTLIVPTRNGASNVYALGISINFAKAVSR